MLGGDVELLINVHSFVINSKTSSVRRLAQDSFSPKLIIGASDEETSSDSSLSDESESPVRSIKFRFGVDTKPAIVKFWDFNPKPVIVLEKLGLLSLWDKTSTILSPTGS